MPIALATCERLPNLDPDDQRLLPALKQLDISAEVAVWSDPAVDWSRFDACIIRSTWDYVDQRERYVSWAQQVAARIPLWNPAPVIAWNTDKTYLRELEIQGIPVVPTRWLCKGDKVHLDTLAAETGWTEWVVKPVVSAAGVNTHRVRKKDANAFQPVFEELLAREDVMVQPYFPSIETTGELSFIYLNGELSHAVAKRPAPDNFLIHEHLGGQYQTFAPTRKQLAQTGKVLTRVPWPLLYARVDMMLDEAGQMCLSELEVTEPSLYLGYDPESPMRLARAIRQRLLKS